MFNFQPMMNRLKKIPPRVFLRYLLLMLPGTAILVLALVLTHRGLGLSKWLSALIVCLWVVKELVVFPFVWESYDTTRRGISGVITGARGIVIDQLAPVGRVRVKGEIWRAECADKQKSLQEGMLIRVVRRRGLTLFVEPL